MPKSERMRIHSFEPTTQNIKDFAWLGTASFKVLSKAGLIPDELVTELCLYVKNQVGDSDRAQGIKRLKEFCRFSEGMVLRFLVGKKILTQESFPGLLALEYVERDLFSLAALHSYIFLHRKGWLTQKTLVSICRTMPYEISQLDENDWKLLDEKGMLQISWCPVPGISRSIEWNYIFGTKAWKQRHNPDYADAHPLLFFFGAVEHIKEYSKELYALGKKGVIDRQLSPEAQFKQLMEYLIPRTPMYKKIIARGKIPEEIRADNAKRINTRQARILRQALRDASISPFEGDTVFIYGNSLKIGAVIAKLKNIPASRSRDFYIRWRNSAENADRFISRIGVSADEWLQRNHFSQIYDRIGVLTRDPHGRSGIVAEPTSIIGINPARITYHPVEEDDFRWRLWADAVHLTHGSNESGINRSHPILASATIMNEDKRGGGKESKDYTALHIDLDKHDPSRKTTAGRFLARDPIADAERRILGEKRQNTLLGLTNEFLHALVQQESDILAKFPPRKPRKKRS